MGRYRGVMAVSDESTGRIRDVPALDLGVGEYIVGPPEWVRNWDERLTAALTDDADSNSPRHRFDVERADEGRLLEVVEGDESDVGEWVGSGEGEFTGATDRHFLFRSPTGDPLLVLHRGGVATTYTLRAAATGAVLATWSKSLGFVGAWQLAAPDGTTRATVERERAGATVLSFPTRRGYVVRSSGGAELARFERTCLEPGPVETVYELSVSVERCAIPAVVSLALGVGILVEAGSSNEFGPAGTGGL